MELGDIGTHQPLLPHNIYSPTGEVKTEPKNSLGEYASAPTKGRWYAAETENALPDTSSSQNDVDIGYLLLRRYALLVVELWDRARLHRLRYI